MLTVYAYKHDGKYVTDNRVLNLNNPKMQVAFASPANNQEYSFDTDAKIIVAVTGKPAAKVELYLGSGQLVDTFTQAPYEHTVNWRQFMGGPQKTVKLNIPVQVKAYDENGNFVTAGIDVWVLPQP
jgi:hypothetical protein